MPQYHYVYRQSTADQIRAMKKMYVLYKYIPHLAIVILAAIGAALPISFSFSVIHTAPDTIAREEIITCSYLQAIQQEPMRLVPFIAFVLLLLLAVAVTISYFMRKKARKVIDIVMTVLSAVALVSVLALIPLYGLDRFTPTSLTVAYLLVCSLVLSIQQLTGRSFIDPTKEE